MKSHVAPLAALVLMAATGATAAGADRVVNTSPITLAGPHAPVLTDGIVLAGPHAPITSTAIVLVGAGAPVTTPAITLEGTASAPQRRTTPHLPAGAVTPHPH